jgi:hypothetical protein
MVLYPVHRLIFKIVFKMVGRAYGVGRARAVFLCGFASEKNTTPLCLNTILEDLKDVQDGVISCPSFNLLNLVQEDGQGGAPS